MGGTKPAHRREKKRAKDGENPVRYASARATTIGRWTYSKLVDGLGVSSSVAEEVDTDVIERTDVRGADRHEQAEDRSDEYDDGSSVGSHS